MAISTVKKLPPFKYTPESEQGEDLPASFRIGQLNGEQYLEVMAASGIDENGDPKISGSAMKLALRFAVLGWENVTNEDGKIIKFSYNNLKNLPVDLLMELVGEIFARSNVDGDESKNS